MSEWDGGLRVLTGREIFGGGFFREVEMEVGVGKWR